MSTTAHERIRNDLLHQDLTGLLNIPDSFRAPAVRNLADQIGEHDIERVWASQSDPDNSGISHEGTIYVLSNGEIFTAKVGGGHDGAVTREPLRIKGVDIEEEWVNADKTRRQRRDRVSVTLHRHGGDDPAPIIASRDMDGDWDDTNELQEWASRLTPTAETN